MSCCEFAMPPCSVGSPKYQKRLGKQNFSTGLMAYRLESTWFLKVTISRTTILSLQDPVTIWEGKQQNGHSFMQVEVRTLHRMFCPIVYYKNPYRTFFTEKLKLVTGMHT